MRDTKDKILQPFFATEPTGLATGLGRSLAYDILAFCDGGEPMEETLSVEEAGKKGEDTVFAVQLSFGGNVRKMRSIDIHNSTSDFNPML